MRNRRRSDPSLLIIGICVLVIIAVLIYFINTAGACERHGFFMEAGPAVASAPTPSMDNENPLLFIRVGFEYDFVRIELGHQSSIHRGPPFNSLVDQKVQDHLAVMLRYNF